MISFAIFACLVQFATYTLANSTALKEFKDGNIDFTSDLYKKLVLLEPSNFMVSPLSIELALALLESGSVGTTAEEIRVVLHLPSTEPKTEKAVKELIPSLTTSKKYTFEIANKIYVGKNFTINQTYKEVAINVFQADVETINFAQQIPAANTINKWVANKTNNKIQNLISPESLKNAVSVIINTIYMNGNWSIQFDPKATIEEPFYVSIKKTVQVKTMHQMNTFHKFKEDVKLQAKFLQMDLLDANASVTFVLPNDINGLSALENQIDNVLNTFSLTWERVTIALPTFEIFTTLELKDILEKLGIKAAFNPKDVNLSKIGGKKGDIFVSEVIQKTYIKVNEGGIEATAATAVIIRKTATVALPPPPPGKLFIANHPFIYIVQVKKVVVFIGRYKGPKQ